MGEESNILRRMMSGDIGNADILDMVIAMSNKVLCLWPGSIMAYTSISQTVAG